MGIQLSDCVENIVGNGEIACYKQFLLFPQCFKSPLLLMSQNEYLWSKGLITLLYRNPCMNYLLYELAFV